MELVDELREEIESNVWSHWGIDELPSEEDVYVWVDMLLKLHLDMSPKYAALKEEVDREAFKKSVVDKYHHEQSCKQQVGGCIEDSDENIPWLPEVRDAIDWHYWNQYAKYLHERQHWSRDVVSTISEDSERILALTGNPNSPDSFNKKGLVVGYVQSGKTANYIGLMARAADAGYRYIIVLASTTNDLRSQTQKRIEEGLIGIDYRTAPKGGLPIAERVGVGNMPGWGRHPNLGTTRKDDFNRNKAKALFQIADNPMVEPWVFVLKKNVSTLKNLIVWLKASDPDGALFLIDDEADNASINTKHYKEDVSRINEQIRELLAVFRKSVYVGYTATPYANILVDKDEVDEKLGKDLFPRNFIYTLNASDSYFGADEVFGDIEPDDTQITTRPKYIRFLYDIGAIPPNKKDIEIDELPQSLYAALRTFAVASAIRVTRAKEDCHTTMLINVSLFNVVQKRLKAKVDTYLKDVLIPAIKVNAGKAPTDAVRDSSEIAMLYDRWVDEYESNTELTWEEVYPALALIARNLHSALINQKSKDGLEYSDHVEHVVAIGGLRLSRGLTLEGLVVSYFSRNSRAYDTLLQMSRWFGHRPGYEDICRIWMTEESAGWCRFVADATDELMNDLVVMQQKGATPLEVGHKIRAHPSTLMVTARNKMGGGEERGEVNLNCKLHESAVLARRNGALAHNEEVAYRLVQELMQEGCAKETWGEAKHEGGGTGILYRDVPHGIVESFISGFIPSRSRDAKVSSPDTILKQIQYCVEEGHGSWDVFFPNKGVRSAPEEGVTFTIDGTVYVRQRRRPGTRTSPNSIYIGNRYKVSTKGIDQVGLESGEISDAYRAYLDEKKHNSRASLDLKYREKRHNPLLVIHFLCVRFDSKTDYDNAVSVGDRKDGSGDTLKETAWSPWDKQVAAVAYSISFPQLQKDRNVSYVFNPVALEGLDLDWDDDDWDGEDEDAEAGTDEQ